MCPNHQNSLADKSTLEKAAKRLHCHSAISRFIKLRRYLYAERNYAKVDAQPSGNQRVQSEKALLAWRKP
jgi:hypothetical protein